LKLSTSALWLDQAMEFSRRLKKMSTG